MDDSQYRDIEEQALQIVGTLNKLKDEIEGYREAKIETQESLKSLDSLLAAVTDATKQLGSAAKDLRKSDYVKLHEQLTKEAEQLTTASNTLQQNLDALPGKLEEMLAADSGSREAVQNAIGESCDRAIEKLDELPETISNALKDYDSKQAEKDKELLERLAGLEEVISRIDRNTQKGFGKERG